MASSDVESRPATGEGDGVAARTDADLTRLDATVIRSTDERSWLSAAVDRNRLTLRILLFQAKSKRVEVDSFGTR